MDDLMPNERYDYQIHYRGTSLFESERISSFPAPVESSPIPLSFLFIADMQNGDFSTMIRHIEHDAPKAVALFSLGDNIKAAGAETVKDFANRWYRYFFHDIMSVTRGIPFYPVLGNHDVGNSSEYAREGRRAFREVFELPFESPTGRTYYSIDIGDVHFQILDAVGRELDDEQLGFIQRDLARSEVPYKIVLLHHQIFGCEQNPYQGGATIKTAYKMSLHELFLENGVFLVLSGHRHYYQVARKDGIYYVTLPTLAEANLIPDDPDDPRVFSGTDAEILEYIDDFYGYGYLEIGRQGCQMFLKGYREGSPELRILRAVSKPAPDSEHASSHGAVPGTAPRFFFSGPGAAGRFWPRDRVFRNFFSPRR